MVDGRRPCNGDKLVSRASDASRSVRTRVEAVIGNAVADRERASVSGRREAKSIASNNVFVSWTRVERGGPTIQRLQQNGRDSR